MTTRPIFQDTTILVDRVILKHDRARADAIATVLKGRFPFACRYSRLEFKRVVIRNLSLILRYLSEEKSFFSAFKRATRVRTRRSDTLVNILAWIGHEISGQIEVRIGDDADLALCERAE